MPEHLHYYHYSITAVTVVSWYVKLHVNFLQKKIYPIASNVPVLQEETLETVTMMHTMDTIYAS